MTSIQYQNVLTWPFIYVVFLIFLCSMIKNKRVEHNRIAYSRTEKFAFFNIVTLGYFFGLVLIPIISMITTQILTLAFVQIYGIILVHVPITTFLLIISRGKKIEKEEISQGEEIKQISKSKSLFDLFQVRFTREVYTESEIFIIAIGFVVIGVFVLCPLYYVFFTLHGYSTQTFVFPLVIFVSIALFLLIILWGKKTEEVENSDIVIMGSCGEPNDN